METGVKLIGLAVLIIVVVLIGIWLGTWVWQWIVPDIFAGAVAHGTLPATITMWQSFKLSIFIWIWGLRTTSSSSNKKD